MKRLWAAALLALGLTLFTGCKGKKPEPEELLTEYMDLLNQEKYEEMYAYLTEEAKAAIDQEAYVERYFTPEAKADVEAMAEEIKGIYKERGRPQGQKGGDPEGQVCPYHGHAGRRAFL